MSVIKSVRIDEEIIEKLNTVSVEMNRKANWIINEALREYLAKSENLSLKKNAEAQLALIRNEKNNWEDFIDYDL